MHKLYKPMRIGLIFVIMAAMLTVFVVALYEKQIYTKRPTEAELYPQNVTERTETLKAARGNIYDRNGVLLASGRVVYNVVIDRDALMMIPAEKRNEIIRQLVFISTDKGIRYNDSLPVTMGAPFTYVSDITSGQRTALDAYYGFFDLDPNISAPDLLAWMRSHYLIDFMTSTSEARLLIGIRYEIELRAVLPNLPSYIFAGDISVDHVPAIEELGLIGVSIEKDYVRQYHTQSASHLLGYVGVIPADNTEHYTENGYPLDAVVGREGAELAFEDLLRGTNGSRYIETDENGTVMDERVETVPIPGQHVYLTMDIGLQAMSEDALRSHIESINLEIEESKSAITEETEDSETGTDSDDVKITGGAVAVVDVNSGELLAAASYPTFNRETFSRDFTLLNSDPNTPLLNRATQGVYNPGSTFKMITGLAALRDGIIGRYTPINDTGIYDRYENYQPTCWIYPDSKVGHGELDIVHALEQSCNYFFIYAADRIQGGDAAGAEAIARMASEFGLGRSTGLEIPESRGTLATPASKMQAQNQDWYSGDTLQSSFGQSLNYYTPVQLANYAATIANGGTLHELTLKRRVVSADTSETLFTHEPVVRNEFREKEYIEIIQEGMLLVTQSNLGTAQSVFRDYPVSVAAKTGTVQLESAVKDNGVFVCYAPADDPQIAISIVIEKGGSGAAVMDIARNIFDYYFGSEITAFTVPYGDLIP